MELEQIKEIALNVKGFDPSLNVEIAGLWIWVSGTKELFNFKCREYLKSLGFRYAYIKQKWYFAGVKTFNKKPMDYSYILNKYGCEEIEVLKW